MGILLAGAAAEMAGIARMMEEAGLGMVEVAGM